jgi:ribosomal protein S18 acetylase RimI-like enzyme
VRIWRASPEEAALVAELIREFGEWWGSSVPPLDEIENSVERIIKGRDGEFLLGSAGADSAAAGVCQVRFRWSVWKSAEDCWVEDLYVREDARRSGLGRALVEAAVERARERGCRRIELDVNEDNAAARALYEACGFLTEPKPPGRTLFIGRPL